MFQRSIKNHVESDKYYDDGKLLLHIMSNRVDIYVDDKLWNYIEYSDVLRIKTRKERSTWSFYRANYRKNGERIYCI